ncbi:MAG: tRNA (cytidine(34)-2'-O)-methyltransferase [Verrucomicrobiota bacterium]|nr:tRNA (cytidine(34)-2'-O)-methyltransferase [Verrucomicrobiota bacterium]
MLHIVLFRPEIPQNTGNIGRMCAYTGARLHLIRPLGFEITDRQLKRSGMDYWKSLDLHIHADWDAFMASAHGPKRLWLFTTKGAKCYWEARFADEDGLVFGNEGHGAPDWLHEQVGNGHRLFIPRYNDLLRSLNLSTSAGIAAFEALRQLPGRHTPLSDFGSAQFPEPTG